MTDIHYVVSSDWLFENFQEQDLRIIDCRFSLALPELGRQQYLASHIPGAYYLDLNHDLSAPVSRHGGRHPLPNPDEIANKLVAMGVNFQKTLVVAYDDSRLAFAARLWWLLRYLGHERVAVLDGGFSGWQAAGYPITADVSSSQPGTFVPQERSHWVVDRKTVKVRKDLPGVALVDSRESDRYSGERETIDPIAGHIPGAVNYPWQEVTDQQGFLKPVAAQRQRWMALESEQEILVYCGSGVTACVNLLSLEMAGICTGKLYPGSWSDWCSYLVTTEA